LLDVGGVWVRVNDLDFERRELTVRDGKGGRNRLTLLPQSLVAGLHPLGVRSPADIV
jgi:hypothetical protein